MALALSPQPLAQAHILRAHALHWGMATHSVIPCQSINVPSSGLRSDTTLLRSPPCTFLLLIACLIIAGHA